MARQAIIAGAGAPIFLNETGARQAITAAPIYINESSGTATGAGALTGVGTLAGVGASAFAGVGALTGVGSLLGVGASAFAGVGTLSGMGSLAGVGASAFAGTGTLTGVGSLLGVGASLFEGTGSLSGGGILSGISGTISVGHPLTMGMLGFGPVSFGPLSTWDPDSFPPPPATTGPNALRRMLQSQYAADARRREAEGTIAALQAMFGPDQVATEQQRLQALEKLRIEAIIAEDDDDILPFIGP